MNALTQEETTLLKMCDAIIEANWSQRLREQGVIVATALKSRLTSCDAAPQAAGATNYEDARDAAILAEVARGFDKPPAPTEAAWPEGTQLVVANMLRDWNRDGGDAWNIARDIMRALKRPMDREKVARWFCARNVKKDLESEGPHESPEAQWHYYQKEWEADADAIIAADAKGELSK